MGVRTGQGSGCRCLPIFIWDVGAYGIFFSWWEAIHNLLCYAAVLQLFSPSHFGAQPLQWTNDSIFSGTESPPSLFRFLAKFLLSLFSLCYLQWKGWAEGRSRSSGRSMAGSWEISGKLQKVFIAQSFLASVWLSGWAYIYFSAILQEIPCLWGKISIAMVTSLSPGLYFATGFTWWTLEHWPKKVCVGEILPVQLCPMALRSLHIAFCLF